MAKRARKEKTTEERAQIEADRLAAHAYQELDEALPPLEQTYLKELAAEPEVRADLAEATNQLNAMIHNHKEFMNEVEAEIEADALTESEIAEAIAAVPIEGEEQEEKVPNSIVKDKFKVKYAENAAAIGDTRKQVKRSNWDWLAQQLAAACLSEKGKIEIGAFTDILEANGVDHSRWTNRNKGWEGRFRMTGRVALQKVVANAGVLKTPAGTELEVPADFRERYKTKA